MELFVFTKDEIFEALKTESSLFAIRQFPDAADPLYEQVLFDEQYSDVVPLFRQLFFEAQAEIISVVPDSMLNSTECAFIDEFAADDFMFKLSFTKGHEKRYNKAYFKAVSIKVKEALVAYIMYRWLETKMPEYANIYKGRYDVVLGHVRRNIRRCAIGSIKPFPW